MIQLIFAMLIIGCLWFFMSHHQQNAIKEELPTSDTVIGFQSDVKRAQAAADKANNLIKHQERDLQHDIKQIQ